MIQTKGLPVFGRCRQRGRSWVSFPSLEASSRCVATSLVLPPVWLMSPGESLGAELHRRDDNILDVVPLLGASRLETRLGGPLLHSSGAHRCLRLISRGAMHVVVDESKTTSFSVQTKFRHRLAILV